MFLPLFGTAAFVALFELATLAGDGTNPMQVFLDEQNAANLVALDTTVETYRTGGFLDIVVARAGQVMLIWGSWIFAVPNVLGLFAIGNVAGRRGWLARPDLARIRRWLPGLALVGGAASRATGLGALPRSPRKPLDHDGARTGRHVDRRPGALPDLRRNPGARVSDRRGRRLLDPLAAVGRMALTNYLAHSIVFTTIALPWGLGLYGRVRPSIAVAAAVAVYLLQISLSQWWLSRFRFGPFEWLWRSMTYGKLQPLRRT